LNWKNKITAYAILALAWLVLTRLQAQVNQPPDSLRFDPETGLTVEEETEPDTTLQFESETGELVPPEPTETKTAAEFVLIYTQEQTPVSGYAVSHDELSIRLRTSSKNTVEIPKRDIQRIIRMWDREDVTANYLPDYFDHYYAGRIAAESEHSLVLSVGCGFAAMLLTGGFPGLVALYIVEPTVPVHHLRDDMTSDQKKDFEDGYKTAVKKRRLAAFVGGAFVCAALRMVLLK